MILGIVATQLSVMFTLCVASAYFKGFGDFMNEPKVAIISLIVLITCVSLLVCGDKSWRMNVPWNYVLLMLGTLAEAASVAAMTAKFEVGAVLTAIFVLAITLVCLFASAYCIKDSTQLKSALISSCGVSSLVILFVTPFILMSTYGKGYEWAWVVFAVVGCFLSAAYVIFDLLYIMDPELCAQDEYILAAFFLYIDIVRLFIYILVLLSEKK